MDRIKLLLFYSRDFLVRNFMVYPKALVFKHQLIYFDRWKILLYWLFRLSPFCFVRTMLGLVNIGIIYKLDSIYNLTNVQQNHIVPIILSFHFIDNSSENQINFTSKIKYYNGSVPLKFVMKENSLEEYKKIKIKYLNKGNVQDKIVEVCNFTDSPIFKLFEN